jgi:hypothetical protein
MNITPLSDSQWGLVAPLISNQPSFPARLDGILNVIVNDIPWMFLPADRYLPFRRYTAWVKTGAWDVILSVLFTDLTLRTGVDLWGEWSKWSVSTHKHGRSARRHTPFRLPDGFCADEYDHIVGMLFLRNLSALLEDDRRRRSKI